MLPIEKPIRLLTSFTLRRRLKQEIARLGPWYQPIHFAYGLRTVAVSKTGRISWLSLDRGVRKWRKFIRPNLPFPLHGRRVLELGCNAGLFLICAVREGAAEAIGIERDELYVRQAEFVVELFSGLHRRAYPVRIIHAPMETFHYQKLGRVDIALFLNVIYHVGKGKDVASRNPGEIRAAQVATIRAVAEVADVLLFEGNPIVDEGRGKGHESLRSLVVDAGLRIVRDRRVSHPRGYILIADSH